MKLTDKIKEAYTSIPASIKSTLTALPIAATIAFSQPTEAQTPKKIQAQQTKSKEVLVYWDAEKDKAYLGKGIPVVAPGDTLRIEPGLVGIEGPYKIDSNQELPEGYSFENINGTKSLVISPEAQYTNLNFSISSADSTESVRLIVGADTEHINKNINELKAKIAVTEQMKEMYKGEAEQYARILEENKKQLESYQRMLDQTFQHIADQDEKITDLTKTVHEWDAGPYAGFSSTGVPEYGLKSTIPGGTRLGFIYTTPSSKNLGTMVDETRNEVPNDTGRPGSKLGEDVRQTETSELRDSYKVIGTLTVPVTSKFSAGIAAGTTKNTYTTTITITEGFWREREDVDGNIVRLNERQEEPVTFTEKKNYATFGPVLEFSPWQGLTFSVTGLGELTGKGIDNYSVSGGVSINIPFIKRQYEEGGK